MVYDRLKIISEKVESIEISEDSKCEILMEVRSGSRFIRVGGANDFHLVELYIRVLLPPFDDCVAFCAAVSGQ